MSTGSASFDAILARDEQDQARGLGVWGKEPPQPPLHCITFVTSNRPDLTDLVELATVGMMPVPGVGEVIALHDSEVTVAEVQTTYTRTDTGRTQIYTFVVVNELTPGQRALAKNRTIESRGDEATSDRVRVRVLLLVGDQAEIVADAADALKPARYRAADIAVAVGVSLAELPGLRLSAVVGRDGRLSGWQLI
ncbi:hypothetical protein [Streptomyces sp. x-80]|uniref:hypothetical protein n=1 Tax=Streptomyces sp. x-80 TaxID=2789282 RepID=UPI00398014FB